MKIEAANITVNRSSFLEIQAGDEIKSCLIHVLDSEIGAIHPIRIKKGAIFERNIIESQITDPILLDPELDEGFLDTHLNIVHIRK